MSSIAQFTSRQCRPGRRSSRDVHMVALVHELPSALRTLRLATLAESLQNGVPVNPWALTVSLAAHADRVDDPMRWLVDDVESLLWYAINEFVNDRELPVPEGCAAALHALLAVAVRDKMLDPGSDCTRQLFAALNRLTTG